MNSWATDLVRLVAKFGKNLSGSTASISRIIPPFCPLEHAPGKQFTNATSGINVLRLSSTSLDDCLSTLYRPGEQLTAIACCAKYFAVGSSSGKIVVYHDMTCQDVQELHHLEPVRMLQFGQKESLIACSGFQILRLWDSGSWQRLWQVNISHDCLSLQFIDEDSLLLGALRNNQFMIWESATGTLCDSADWTEDSEGQRNHAYRRPTCASIHIE